MARTTQLTARVTYGDGIAQDEQVDNALRDVYEAYQVFCAYGTHPTSWKNLAVQLHLYFESVYLSGLPANPEKSAFARLLGKLDTYQLAYLLSDTLLALFYLSSIQSGYDKSWLYIFKEDQARCDEFELRNVENKDLPFYLIRRYLPKIPFDELLILLLNIRLEVHNREYLSHSLFCFDKAWSPSSGCYPAILLHCSVQLPPHAASALMKYAIQTGTHQLMIEKPKPRTELRSALLRIPKLLIRAATYSPSDQSRGAKLDQSSPLPNPFSTELAEDISGKEHLQIKESSPNHADTDQASQDAINIRIGSKKNQTAPKPNRVRALSFDSFGKNDRIPSPKVTFEAFWRRRKVTSWPSISSMVEERDEESSYPDILSEATDDTSNEQVVSPIFSTSGSMFGSVTSHTSVEEELSESVPDWPSGAVLNSDSNDPKKRSGDDMHSVHEDSPIRDEDPDILFGQLLAPMPSDRSSASTHQSFVTANSNHQSFMSCQRSSQNRHESFQSYETFGSVDDGAPALSDYLQLLQQCDLIPEPMIETNWSGRGQHCEYTSEERQLIPLKAEKILGQTRTAVVESVRCKRVRLVRKIIRCNKRTGVKREEAVSEVQHLYRAQHGHIVRLVGTYVIEDELAILTYPCAEWDLQQFMSTAAGGFDSLNRVLALRKFFTCLAKVLDFMHSFPIKHMDIKPQNLLVRDIRHCAINESDHYKIYVTDFGISRSYPSAEDCDTETPTSFTRTYAAMEVVLQESRGLAADIFSLACVYTEMLATVLDLVSILENISTEETVPTYRDTLRAARTHPESGLRPYHSTIPQVSSWLSSLPIYEPELSAVRDWILRMLDNDATNRPTARQISDDPHLPFACLSCTLRSGPEDFEAAFF